MYSDAIAAASSYFYARGYVLANELILHFGSNTDLDSIYSPIHSDIIKNSSIYNSILDSNLCEGTGEFTNQGSVDDKDLHYAINKFMYYKSQSNRAVIIKDRYDFANSDSYGLSDSIISVLVAGQDAGFLFPYYTVIENEYEGTIQNQVKYFSIKNKSRIFEDVATLGRNESVDYYITFPYDGEKIIQTFGDKDAYLYVYDQYNQVIAANDDGGYMLNPFLNCNLQSGIQYLVRVIFENDDYGTVKLCISWTDGDYITKVDKLNYYWQIYNTNSTPFSLKTSIPLHKSKFLVFRPKQTNKYEISTYGNYDTYIYLIDPRLTNRIIGSNFENDDGGQNLNACLITYLSKDVDYLIIYSHYSLSIECSFFITINTK